MRAESRGRSRGFDCAPSNAQHIGVEGASIRCAAKRQLAASGTRLFIADGVVDEIDLALPGTPRHVATTGPIGRTPASVGLNWRISSAVGESRTPTIVRSPEPGSRSPLNNRRELAPWRGRSYRPTTQWRFDNIDPGPPRAIDNQTMGSSFRFITVLLTVCRVCDRSELLPMRGGRAATPRGGLAGTWEAPERAAAGEG